MACRRDRPQSEAYARPGMRVQTRSEVSESTVLCVALQTAAPTTNTWAAPRYEYHFSCRNLLFINLF